MAPPYKRRCIPRSDNHDADFHERRARNDLRLKSVFESIFEKYGKDFSGIADEINLQTGEIVVNRGHVHGMRDETDPGCEEDLYDELNYDDRTEEIDRQGKADLLGVNPQLSTIEADVHVGKDFCGGHSDRVLRSGPRSAQNEVSNLSWKSRLQSRPSAVNSSHQPLDLSFIDGQAIEPAWRAPPLPEQVASVQEVASVPLFNPHQREHERSASLPGASLWAPEASKSCSERSGGHRQKKNSSMRHPKSPTIVTSVGKDLPVANLSSPNYEWPRISGHSKLGQTIERSVPSTPQASSVVREPTGTAAWTLREYRLLRSLKSAGIVDHYPERTEADLENPWFELHALSTKVLSLEHDVPHTRDQRITAPYNKDRQILHNGSRSTFQILVPDSLAHLPGAQERVLPKVTESNICGTRNFGSEQQPGKQKAKSRKSFKYLSQSTFGKNIRSRKPTRELRDRVNRRRDMPSMSSSMEANQKDSDRVTLASSYVNHHTNQDSTVMAENQSSKPRTNFKLHQRSSDLLEKCKVLEETSKVPREKPVEYHWEIQLQGDRPQDRSKYTNATCKSCFSQNTSELRSQLCSACYHYALTKKRDRPPSLALKRLRKVPERYGYSHMPVRRHNGISHEAKPPDISPPVKVPKSQPRSNETSGLPTMTETPRTAEPSDTVPTGISPPDDLSAPRTVEPITVPTSISLPDDLSDDELSMLVQTVGTRATGATKLKTPSSHAPR